MIDNSRFIYPVKPKLDLVSISWTKLDHHLFKVYGSRFEFTSFYEEDSCKYLMDRVFNVLGAMDRKGNQLAEELFKTLAEHYNTTWN